MNSLGYFALVVWMIAWFFHYRAKQKSVTVIGSGLITLVVVGIGALILSSIGGWLISAGPTPDGTFGRYGP